MSTGLISLAAGVLIGLMYAALKVRSPAPPALALMPDEGPACRRDLAGRDRR